MLREVGRAGRGGQAALVFTYCSSYSSHDRHYFENRQDLVAGIVEPPRIDLCNQELLLSHLNSIILTFKGIPELSKTITDVVDINDSELILFKKIKNIA
jgi:hypothetical protein